MILGAIEDGDKRGLRMPLCSFLTLCYQSVGYPSLISEVDVHAPQNPQHNRIDLL